MCQPSENFSWASVCSANLLIFLFTAFEISLCLHFNLFFNQIPYYELTWSLVETGLMPNNRNCDKKKPFGFESSAKRRTGKGNDLALEYRPIAMEDQAHSIHVYLTVGHLAVRKFQNISLCHSAKCFLKYLFPVITVSLVGSRNKHKTQSSK